MLSEPPLMVALLKSMRKQAREIITSQARPNMAGPIINHMHGVHGNLSYTNISASRLQILNREIVAAISSAVQGWHPCTLDFFDTFRDCGDEESCEVCKMAFGCRLQQCIKTSIKPRIMLSMKRMKLLSFCSVSV